MRAGTLNRRGTIERLKTDTDEYGEPLPGREVVATVWSDIKHMSGLETVKSGVDVSIVKASIRIRYRTGVTAGMFFVCDGLVYDIRAVMPDAARREFVDLVCEIGRNLG